MVEDLNGGEREGPVMDGRILWYMYSGLYFIASYIYLYLVCLCMDDWTEESELKQEKEQCQILVRRGWQDVFFLAGLMLTIDNVEICLAQMHTFERYK